MSDINNNETKPLSNYLPLDEDEDDAITTDSFNLTIENFNQRLDELVDEFLNLAEQAPDNTGITNGHVYTKLFGLIQLSLRMHDKAGIKVRSIMRFDLNEILNNEYNLVEYLNLAVPFFENAFEQNISNLSLLDKQHLISSIYYLSQSKNKMPEGKFISMRVAEEELLLARASVADALSSSSSISIENLASIMSTLLSYTIALVPIDYARRYSEEINYVNDVTNWQSSMFISSSEQPNTLIINVLKQIFHINKHINYSVPEAKESVNLLGAVLNETAASILKSNVTDADTEINLDLTAAQSDVEKLVNLIPGLSFYNSNTAGFDPEETAETTAVSPDTDETSEFTEFDDGIDDEYLSETQTLNFNIIGDIFDFDDLQDHRLEAIARLSEVNEINNLSLIYKLTRDLLSIEERFDEKVQTYLEQLIDLHDMFLNPEASDLDLDELKYKIISSLSSTLRLYQKQNKGEYMLEISNFLNKLMQ